MAYDQANLQCTSVTCLTFTCPYMIKSFPCSIWNLIHILLNSDLHAQIHIYKKEKTILKIHSNNQMDKMFSVQFNPVTPGE